MIMLFNMKDKKAPITYFPNLVEGLSIDLIRLSIRKGSSAGDASEFSDLPCILRGLDRRRGDQRLMRGRMDVVEQGNCP